MVATDVRQAELEREVQLDRLREVCEARGINLHNDSNILDGGINYSHKLKIAFVGSFVESESIDTLIDIYLQNSI